MQPTVTASSIWHEQLHGGPEVDIHEKGIIIEHRWRSATKKALHRTQSTRMLPGQRIQGGKKLESAFAPSGRSGGHFHGPAEKFVFSTTQLFQREVYSPVEKSHLKAQHKKRDLEKRVPPRSGGLMV